MDMLKVENQITYILGRIKPSPQRNLLVNTLMLLVGHPNPLQGFQRLVFLIFLVDKCNAESEQTDLT